MPDDATAPSTTTLSLAAEFEDQGVTYAVRHEPASTREDCRPAWLLFRGNQFLAELPMREVMGHYTPRDKDLVATATDALVGLAPYASATGPVDWAKLVQDAAEKSPGLNHVTKLIMDRHIKAESALRLTLAKEHERLTTEQTFSSGMALGIWAGRGDYSTLKPSFRDQQGIDGLAKFDAEIAALDDYRARLIDLRNRLAQVISPNAGGNVPTEAETAADVEP